MVQAQNGRSGLVLRAEVQEQDQELSEHVSEEDLDMVVARIRRITRTANLEFALRVGAVVLHHFYDGNTDAWRARGAKTASFRRLAAHPDLPLSAGALYRCVALYELCERFNAPRRWEHLGASHLRLVLGLNPPDQECMLAAANEHRWTVKDFRRAMECRGLNRIQRGGRRAKPSVARVLRSVQRCLDEEACRVRELGPLSESDLEESLDLLANARQAFDRVSELLHQVRARK